MYETFINNKWHSHVVSLFSRFGIFFFSFLFILEFKTIKSTRKEKLGLKFTANVTTYGADGKVCHSTGE